MLLYEFESVELFKYLFMQLVFEKQANLQKKTLSYDNIYISWVFGGSISRLIVNLFPGGTLYSKLVSLT